MSFVISHVLPLFESSIAGYLTYWAMQGIDDVLKLTARWPDTAKQGAVVFIGALLPVLNHQFGLQLPVDPAQLLTQPGVQGVIAVLVAFFIKHANAPAPAKPVTAPAP